MDNNNNITFNKDNMNINKRYQHENNINKKKYKKTNKNDIILTIVNMKSN